MSRMTCLISLVPKECLGNDFGWFPKNVWEMNLVGQKILSFISIINKFDLIKKVLIFMSNVSILVQQSMNDGVVLLVLLLLL